MAATPERRSIKGINEVDESFTHAAMRTANPSSCTTVPRDSSFLYKINTIVVLQRFYPGFTGSGLVWLAMVAHLPLQQYRCIIFDTRGSGSNTATYAHCMLSLLTPHLGHLLLIHLCLMASLSCLKTATSHSSAWPTT
jgi:hypothetical protein